jgi:hypothetical protein
MWRCARQRLAKHVPERYAINENRRPLLNNGFGYHGIAAFLSGCVDEMALPHDAVHTPGLPSSWNSSARIWSMHGNFQKQFQGQYY